MGTSLNGLTPSTTYPSLLKTSDNTAISSFLTVKQLSDGEGTDLPLKVSKFFVTSNGPYGDANSTMFGSNVGYHGEDERLLPAFTSPTYTKATLIGTGAGSNPYGNPGNYNNVIGIGAYALNNPIGGSNVIGIGNEVLREVNSCDNSIAIANDFNIINSGIGFHQNAVSIATSFYPFPMAMGPGMGGPTVLLGNSVGALGGVVVGNGVNYGLSSFGSGVGIGNNLNLVGVGDGNIAIGRDMSHGINLQPQYSISLGSNITESDYSVLLGNGISTSTYLQNCVAIGSNITVDSNMFSGGIVIGTNTSVTGPGVAIGYGAVSSTTNGKVGIAIGYQADASTGHLAIGSNMTPIAGIVSETTHTQDYSLTIQLNGATFKIPLEHVAGPVV